jgi:hypothetical protein
VQVSNILCRGAQISGARSPGRLNLVWWRLIFVAPLYGTCSTSRFRRLEARGDAWNCVKFVLRCYYVRGITRYAVTDKLRQCRQHVSWSEDTCTCQWLGEVREITTNFGRVQFMKIAIHWHLTPCSLVSTFRRNPLSSSSGCSEYVKAAAPKLWQLAARRHRHAEGEFKSRLMSGKGSEPDSSIVICDNLTDIRPAESPVNTAIHRFLPHKFTKMLL